MRRSALLAALFFLSGLRAASVAPPRDGTAGTPPGLLTREIAEDLAICRDAAIRPDGRLILYGVSVPRAPDDEPGAARHELRVVPASGGPSRLLVGAASDPSSPTWSPDGRWIAFLSGRGQEGSEADASTRVFIMPSDGGEAWPITPKEISVSLYVWSPSSQAIAFVAQDPEPAARKEAARKGADWKVEDRDLRARRLRRVEVPSGALRELTDGKISVWDADWSPDGRQLVLAVTDEPRTDDQYVKRRLVVISAGGGEPRLLVPTRGKIASPRWSPDGSEVAFLSATDAHDPSEGTIAVVGSAGGEPRALTGASDVNFRRIAWLPSRRLIASGEEGTRSVLALVSGSDGALTRLLDRGPIVDGFTCSRDGSRCAMSASEPSHPAEVYTLAIGSAEPTRLTFDNEVLKTIRLGEQAPFRWKARDGTAIEGVLVKPVGFSSGRRYPLIVEPHGGPEFASLDGWVAGYLYLGQVAAARGYLVLLPNYRGSTGRGEAFASADHRDLGGAEFDDILDGIQALVDEGWADPARVGIGGGSYGGYLSAWGATRHSDRFAAAVVLSGIANWPSFTGTTDIPLENTWVHWGLESPIGHLDLLWSRSPVAHLTTARTPTLILHGEKDLRVPLGQGQELYTGLRLKGVPVELVVYPREGHGLRERAHRLDAGKRILEWFDRFLKPGESGS